MKHSGRCALLVLTLLLPLGSLQAAEADAELLHKYDFCLVCHGYDGQGNDIVAAPALAGIEPWYIAQALQSYWEASRHTSASAMEMQSAARMISPDDLGEVQMLVRQFVPRTPLQATAAAEQLQRGAQTYAQYCAACHGTNAEGNQQLAAPGLKRLNSWYLAATWKAYLAGGRGDDNASLAARQMRQFSLTLPANVAIDDLIAFITQ